MRSYPLGTSDPVSVRLNGPFVFAASSHILAIGHVSPIPPLRSRRLSPSHARTGREQASQVREDVPTANGAARCSALLHYCPFAEGSRSQLGAQSEVLARKHDSTRMGRSMFLIANSIVECSQPTGACTSRWNVEWSPAVPGAGAGIYCRMMMWAKVHDCERTPLSGLEFRAAGPRASVLRGSYDTRRSEGANTLVSLSDSTVRCVLNPARAAAT